MASASVPVSRLDDQVFAEIARVVFAELRTSRRNLHAARGALRCDASFQLNGPLLISGGCPCIDDYTEALTEVWRYLRSQDPHEVGSYSALARVHCRLRVVGELCRRRRGTRTQQRTDRLADTAIGRALATPQQHALLRDLVEEAGSDAPLEGEAQLVNRLARLRAQRFGGEAAEHVPGIAADLPIVRQAAINHGRRRRDGAGQLVSWWEFYVEAGLGRRERLTNVPIGSVPESESSIPLQTVDAADRSASTMFDMLFDADAVLRATGEDADDPELALVTAVADAVREQQGTGEAIRTVRDRLLMLRTAGALESTVVDPLVRDLDRLRQVASASREVVQRSPVRVTARDRSGGGTGSR